MAPSCKSAALVVMLVLAALAVSAQAGQEVWVDNRTPSKCKCNGHEIEPGLRVLVEVDPGVVSNLVLAVLGEDGEWVEGECHLPQDVHELAIVVVGGGVGVVVKVVSCVGGLIHQLLNTLIGFICLELKVAVKIR
jgi:hypothetical protein